MTVYMFPGQGSQFIGMGKELFAKFPEHTKKASDILGYSIESLCLIDPEKNLNNTKYTQPALYFICCLAFLELTKNSSPPTWLIGHSLGEYAALFAANVFDLFSGLNIVKKRAELMATVNNGGMAAVLGDNLQDIKSILISNNLTTIDVANYNSVNQYVLSGPTNDLILAKNILTSLNLKVIILPVSGAFHSRYMTAAQYKFIEFLKDFDFKQPEIQIFSPTLMDKVNSKYLIELLGYQFSKPIYWYQSISNLKKLGENNFIEVGPGRVLSKLTGSNMVVNYGER